MTTQITITMPVGAARELYDLCCEIQQHEGNRTAKARVVFGPDITQMAVRFGGSLRIPLSMLAFVAAYEKAFIPSIFDEIIPCCGRPLGVCNLDPCLARKEHWKQVATAPPGAS